MHKKLLKETDFAYFCGVLTGDGHIGWRKHKHEYVIHCVGNAKDEKEYYQTVLIPLIKKLFNLNVKGKHFDKKSTYGFRIYSKKLFKFMVDIAELPYGKKYEALRIPKWCNTKKLKIAFLQGVADTDFCITFKKRNKETPNYPVIIGSSKSKQLFVELSNFLKSLQFRPVCIWDYKVKDNRFKKGFSRINRIELNGYVQLKKWEDLVGFRSPKHLQKVLIWKGK